MDFDFMEERHWFDFNIFYCIYTYTKGLNTIAYNLHVRGSHLKYNCHNTKYYDKKTIVE